MPIEHVQGDLLEVEGDIAHGCNTLGVMGAGVAKAIKEAHPPLFAQYKGICDAGPPLLGESYPYLRPSGYFIFNLMTQDSVSADPTVRNVSYDAISESFKNMFYQMNQHGITEVTIPYIGAGLGGGDWEVIEAIIRSECPKHITVKVTQL